MMASQQLIENQANGVGVGRCGDRASLALFGTRVRGRHGAFLGRRQVERGLTQFVKPDELRDAKVQH